MSGRPTSIATCCAKCGKNPTVVKEPDGYWYVLCELGCESEAAWDTDKVAAIGTWNSEQLLSAKGGAE